MSRSSDAYEHESSATGFGTEETTAGNEHRYGDTTANASTGPNEIDPQEGHRANREHARSTHQDTRITEAEGLKRLREQ